MSSGLRCRAYVHSLGWQPFVGEEEICGTTGMGLYIEALEFQYKNPDEFEYKVKNQEIGWLDTYKANEIAGTIEKNSPLNGFTCSFVGINKHIHYEGHFSYDGWIQEVQDGELMQSLSNDHWLEAIRFHVD